MITVAELLDIDVHGTPAPQGSKRHVGRGIMVESSKKVKPWREAVKAAVLLTSDQPQPPADGPVTVDISFRLARPASHYGTGRNAERLRPTAPQRPTTKPDLDKLIRSTLDALKDVGVYRDDSQVVTIITAKHYCCHDEWPGARIIVRRSA